MVRPVLHGGADGPNRTVQWHGRSVFAQSAGTELEPSVRKLLDSQARRIGRRWKQIPYVGDPNWFSSFDPVVGQYR